MPAFGGTDPADQGQSSGACGRQYLAAPARPAGDAADCDTFAGFESTGWHALFAPTGTPTEVVTRINRELDRILRTPEVVERMLAMGSIAEGSASPQAVGAFVNAEHERWVKIVKSLNIVAG